MAYILIADDDADFAAAVGTVMQSAGHQAAIETNSEKVLDRIAAHRPDAVILDVMFPESDATGFEVARAIRRRFGDLPVLLLTAVNQTVPRSVSDGETDPTWLPVVEFLEKPVDLSRLSQKISELLAGAKK